jgi:hypothetical protein
VGLGLPAWPRKYCARVRLAALSDFWNCKAPKAFSCRAVTSIGKSRPN